MLDCRKFEFSPSVASNRIKKARSVLGEAVVTRLLAFALYLMGMKQSRIAKALGIPLETARSLNRRIQSTGIGALQDRRKSDSAQPIRQAAEAPVAPALSICLSESSVLEIKAGAITIPQENTVQRKVLLLSLIGRGMLSAQQVAEALDLSVQHVQRMQRDLTKKGVDGIVDKRRGQLQDYRVNDEMKGRIVAEFMLALAETGSATSKDVADRMGDKYDEQIAQRTIRHHLKRMGIQQVKGHLLSGLKGLKKTLDGNC